MISRDKVLPHAIAARAADDPDGLAIQTVDGQNLTHADLHASVMRWAGALQRLGVAPGDTVVTLMPNTIDVYAAWLGVSWLRALEVPVHTMYRGMLLAYIIGNAGAKVVVTARDLVGQLRDVSSELTSVEHVVVMDDDEPDPSGLPGSVHGRGAFFGDGTPPDADGPEPYDIAAVLYTSGTTGPSKGVLVPWAELFYLAQVMPADALPPGGAYYSVWPPHHLSGKAAIYFPLLQGARLVMRERFSPTEFWPDVRRFGCTGAGIFGPLAKMLMLAPEQPDDADNPMIGMICAPLFPEHEGFAKRFGVKLATGYGMTETGAVFMSDGWTIHEWRSCGRVRQGPPGFEVRVVDEHDEPLGPGTPGELIVRASEPWTMNAGYLGMPEATATAWRNGWFHTGDAFRYDEDGNFYFVDRMKDTIRRRAENISSLEVEVYVVAHPQVAECAAFGVPSELGEEEVKVCVVLAEGAELDPAELIAFLEPQMPRFMIPRYVEYVASLPKTEATMRVRKVELKADPFTDATWDRELARTKT